jgi:hypothetical protein
MHVGIFGGQNTENKENKKTGKRRIRTPNEAHYTP